MKPDLKETEALLDTLEKRFPDARADVEAVRTQMGLRRRTAESHSPEIKDRLARDSDKKSAPSASSGPQVEKGPPIHGPNDTYVHDPVAKGFVIKDSSCEDRMKEPRPMSPDYDKGRLVTLMDYIAKKDPSQKERALRLRKELGMENKEVPPLGEPMRGMVSALMGIEESATAKPEPKIGEFLRPKPSFPPTIGLYKLAALLHVSPDEVFRARHYIQKHTVSMGCPRSSESDHVSLRTAYAIHLLLHGNEAVHRWIPVTSFCSGVYTDAVREFMSSPSFPYLVKLFMGHEHSSILMALRELFKEKMPEHTTEDLRCLHVLAGVIRHAKNYVPTREKDGRKAD